MALYPPQKGGTELGYAEITSPATSTTLTANVADGTGDVAGLTVTVTTGARPIEATVYAQRFHNNTVTTAAVCSILEDGVEVAEARLDQHATASEGGPLIVRARRNPATGSHTYKAVLTTIAAGTSTLAASATAPASIRVVEG